MPAHSLFQLLRRYLPFSSLHTLCEQRLSRQHREFFFSVHRGYAGLSLQYVVTSTLTFPGNEYNVMGEAYVVLLCLSRMSDHAHTDGMEYPLELLIAMKLWHTFSWRNW